MHVSPGLRWTGCRADAMKRPNTAAHFAIIAQAVDLSLVDVHGYKVKLCEG
jgi:hypothetical protein